MRILHLLLYPLAALAVMMVPVQASTTVNAGAIGTISGPQDLDLLGEIVYAINFSANDPALTVNGVVFTPDTAAPAGATLVGPQNVTPWQTKPEFGDSLSENSLERIFEDIRWANNAAGERLEASLAVTAGETYKLQILINGNHGADDRRWDIEVEGDLSVDEITSLGASLDGSVPLYDPTTAVVFTQQVTVADGVLNIRMGDLGGENDGADRNPIWQGLIVERVVPDSDADGLPDSWETANFGNLSQTATTDADSDGLLNGPEFSLGTNPIGPDTDGDTLTDGAEVNTHGTNPKVQDTDGDGLRDDAELNTHRTNPLAVDTDFDGLADGDELNTHRTNPLNRDSDGDEYDDGVEIANGTSPSNANLFPLLSSHARILTGADAGEGLDLTGNFLYAFNVGTNGAPGMIRGVEFTDETNNGAGGITISATNEIAAWAAQPTFGDSPDDDALENVLWSIRYAGRISVKLSGLTAGKPYKAQLMFLERCCARGADVYVDGVLKLDEFAPYTFQDGTGAPTRTALAVIGFIASGPTAEIVLDGGTVTTPAYTDRSPLLCGVTLEAITGADADGDGLDDNWEMTNFGNLEQTATGDGDADGLTNLQELSQGTDPKLTDTDSDGLSDGAEVNVHLTNAKAADSDGDKLTDGYEVITSQTNPLVQDSDADGYADGAEVAQATDPRNALIYPLIGATVGSFTGGDPGEGLDLSGTFLHSFNVGVPGAAPGPVGDAAFTDDAQEGIIVTAVNSIDNWHAPEYGSTSNDDNLEFVMQSIRWTPAPGTLNVDLSGLTVGKAYKLQLLVAEQCCAGRGYDVEIEGALSADEFNPSIAQLGAGNTARGAVILVGFVAKDDTLNIVLNGNGVTTPTFNDRNSILNGVTLEELALPDTDSDGLPDPWEYQFFGSLTQTAAADADADGRSNQAEYLQGTLPNNADTDKDGLNDGAEFTAGTNPLLADSDRDGLGDLDEVTVLRTNPLLADTDSDTFSDRDEIIAGSNPLLATSLPVSTVGVFTGGDDGEGLDLDGTFLYAFNFGSPGAAGQARDANFTSDSVAGITYVAPNQIPNWHAPVYGDTANDDVVEKVMRSIRWNGAPGTVQVNLDGLVAGQSYKLQLLMAETGLARGFDVKLEGGAIVRNLIPGAVQEGSSNQAVVVGYEFQARDSQLNIVLDGMSADDSLIGDRNPILSGVTLEVLGGAQPSAALNVIGLDAAGITFSASGPAGKKYALDYTPNLATAAWMEVNDSVVIGANGTMVVTDTLSAHLTPAAGFWRLRDQSLRPNP